MAAILDGQFVCEDSCHTILVRIHSEVPENCHFYVFAILVANGHLGLPSHISHIKDYMH